MLGLAAAAGLNPQLTMSLYDSLCIASLMSSVDPGSTKAARGLALADLTCPAVELFRLRAGELPRLGPGGLLEGVADRGESILRLRFGGV